MDGKHKEMMKKVKNKEMMKKDKKMMKYLVGYVMGKPFPLKHTVMDVDSVYGIKRFSPSQIFESTEPEPGKENTRFFITFQDLKNARVFASEAGVWRSSPKHLIPLFDANKTRMGTVKISWYCYYYYNTVKSARRRSRRSEWKMREYYLTSKYLPLNKVERKHVLITMMINTDKEQKANNDIQSLSNNLATLDLSMTERPLASPETSSMLSSSN